MSAFQSCLTSPHVITFPEVTSNELGAALNSSISLKGDIAEMMLNIYCEFTVCQQSVSTGPRHAKIIITAVSCSNNNIY